MALSFAQRVFSFRNLNGTQIRSQTANVTFATPVRVANVALQDINLAFSGNVDHHLQRHLVQVTSRIASSTVVEVTVNVQLRDVNGDDTFEADVTVLVIADLT
ncbi:hypothetical protein I5Q34_32960 [Streptomyces sp. AV19]|uniref:hypothetical protein n=1 Tax=Streptomyces sp. AV19 TaxID=2793068 RepID=UPI0018FE6FC5|nr:hypothetical protein [Streptomyces sp. AV19]MBH1939015.1 hypothetical protein [Streptomyces sp. AV19]MDG4532456.1 hypothetical protein [Streptomyces sp. AV19]